MSPKSGWQTAPGISALSVRRPIGVAMMAIAVMLLGWIGMERLPVDLLPDVEMPNVSVVTNYEGVGPEEIENLLTRPIEQAVSTIDGLVELNSSSSEGMSRVELQFAWGHDLETAVNDVRAALDRFAGRLPDEADKPQVLKFNVSTMPIATVGLSGQGDPRRLRYLADEVLTRRLERISGIASVRVNGGRAREIRVELQPDRMSALGISATQILNALSRDNANVSAGDMREAGREVLIRSLGELTRVEDVEGVLVTLRSGVSGSSQGLPNASGRPVFVRDVAIVRDSYEEVKSEQWVDGSPGIVMRISKQSGANTIAAVEGLKAEIEAINRDYEGRLALTLITDSSKFIESSITNVRDTALMGAVLAILVLLFFLRDLGATLVVGIAIPFSIMATFALMYFLGYTLNLISFGGLALGIGLLIDNAIVILENIYRKHADGLSPKDAAVEGAREVTGAIVAGTLTTVAVFAPVVFLSGFAGIFFSEMAAVVVFSMTCSLVVAVTLVPTLAARLLARKSNPHSVFARIGRRIESWLQTWESGYAKVLARVLTWRWYGVLFSVVLLAVSLRFMSAIDVEMMPETDEGLLDIDVEMPVGTPVERTFAVIHEVERRALEVVKPEERYNVVSSAGPTNPYRPGGGHEGDVEIALVSVSERARSSTEIMGELRKVLTDIPGARIRVRQRTTNALQRFMRGSSGERLMVEVRGHDLKTAAELSERVEAIMKSIDGVADVRIGREEGLEERVVRVDHRKAAELGLSRPEVAELLEIYVLGKVATRLREGGDEYDIRVSLAEEARTDTSQLLNLNLVTSRGAVPLSELAEVQAGRGPSAIDRRSQERVVRVVGGVGERPLSAIVSELREKIAEIELPAGFAVHLGGESEEQAKSFDALTLGIALAVFLVFAVMAIQFESVRYPLIIMSSVPVSFIGVVAILLLTQTSFTLNAFLGTIVLIGIAVNNAIVLVDTANVLRDEEGQGIIEAVVEAGRRRLRPILMTTLTTILGMIPIALAIGEGAEVQAPLARVVLGGLTVSTIITLVLVPTLYVLCTRGGGQALRAAEDAGRL